MQQTFSHGMRVTRRIADPSSAMPVELIELDNSLLKLALVPQRGMGIWRAWCKGFTFGWNSPVHGPVHPALVPLHEPTGMGWLEGFDELLCRCGLTSNGAPDFDNSGTLRYSLHGRIANLPATQVHVEQDPESGAVTIRCEVYETRMHFQKLCLRSKITLQPGASSFELHDEVQNLSARATQIQLMYHYNIGQPLLEAGSRIVAPVKALVPRDARAAAGINTWQHIEAPDANYAEQVYFAQLHADARQQTQVMLQNAKGDLATSIQFDTSQLPYFVIWKNTVDASDGYVCGLEPSTNFPNPRTFEETKGRVVQLDTKASVQFTLRFGFHCSREEVEEVADAIQGLSEGKPMAVAPLPCGEWCI